MSQPSPPRPPSSEVGDFSEALAPPPPPLIDQFFSGLELAKDVQDSSILSETWRYGFVCFVLLVAFVLLRPWHKVYNARLLEPGILRRPAKIPFKNFQWIWAFIMPILFTPEHEILESAGLDALIYLRVIGVGIKFFTGIAAAAFLTLVPLHLTTSKDIALSKEELLQKWGLDTNLTSGFNVSQPFTSISMVRIPPGSPKLWFHFVFVHLVVAWGCWLCYDMYKLFVVLRHNFLGRVMEPERMQPSQAEFPKLRRVYMQSRIGRWLARRRWGEKGNDGFSNPDRTDIGSQTGEPSRTKSVSSAASMFRYSGRNLGLVAAATAMARSMNTINPLNRQVSSRQKRKLMKVIAEQGGSTEFNNNDEPVAVHRSVDVEFTRQSSSASGVRSAGSWPMEVHPVPSVPKLSALHAPDASSKSAEAEAGSRSHAIFATGSDSPEASGYPGSPLQNASPRMFSNVEVAGGSVVGPYVKPSGSQDALRARLFRNMHVKSLQRSKKFDRGGYIQGIQLGGSRARSAGNSPKEMQLSRKSPQGSPFQPFTGPNTDGSDRKGKGQAGGEGAGDEGGNSDPQVESHAISKSQPLDDSGEEELPEPSAAFSDSGSEIVPEKPEEEEVIVDNHSVKITLAPEEGDRAGEQKQERRFSAGQQDPPIPDEPPPCFAATTTPDMKHRVLTLKTVQTMLPSGRPCRVMSELYAVLVTNVPSLRKREEIMRERDESLEQHYGVERMRRRQTGASSRCSLEAEVSDDESPMRDRTKKGPRVENTVEGEVQPSDVGPSIPEDAEPVPSPTRVLVAREDAEVPALMRTTSRAASEAVSEAPSEAPSSMHGGGSKRSTMTGTFIPEECSELGQNRRRSLPKAVAKTLDQNEAFTVNNKREVDFDVADTKSSHNTLQRGDAGGDEDDRVSSADTSGDGLEFDIVAAVFQQMFPNTFFCTIPVRKDEGVQKLMFRWAALTKQLEIAETKLKLWGERPSVKLGAVMGFGGTSTDAIEHFRGQVREVEEEIKQARNDAWQDSTSRLTSAFVLFYDQFSATVAAQSVIHPEDGHIFSTQPAPGPDDINWKALWSTSKSRVVRRVIAFPLLLTIILFPAGLFSAAIANINLALCNTYIGSASEWYCGSAIDQDPGSILFQLISSSAIPSLLLSVWQTVVMPHALYSLTLFQADSYLKSKMDRKIAIYFLMWGFVNVFLGGMLGGMLELANLIADPQDVLARIGESMVRAANFFTQFVQLQTLVIAPLAMFQPHGGLWFYFIAMLLHKRCGGCCLLERDVNQTWEAKSYRYGREIPIHMLIFLLGTIYCTSSPGILPFCLAYFVGFWMVRRYQTMYVFERCYESGGLFWPLVFDAIIYFLLTFQIFMSAVLITFNAALPAGILFITVPAPIFLFRRYCHARFNTTARYLPLEMADRAPPAILDPALYISPPLRHGAAGWHPESRKAWSGYGMATSVV